MFSVIPFLSECYEQLSVFVALVDKIESFDFSLSPKDANRITSSKGVNTYQGRWQTSCPKMVPSRDISISLTAFPFPFLSRILV